MTLELRPYQTDAIAQLRKMYISGKRAPCLVLPTGAGKTVVASKIIGDSLIKGRKVLFLAHRVELVGQTVDKLDRSGISDVRVISAGRATGPADAGVTVASVQTLSMDRWRDKLPEANLVVFDECHHVKAQTWEDLANHYADSWLLGMTATPQRRDGKALGDVFDSLVVGATVKQLTGLGHLVQCKTWSPPRKQGQGKIALEPAVAYRQLADGERAIVFCVTIEHAYEVATQFTAIGVTSDVVHCKLGAKKRRDILKRFAAGEIRVVCNVDVLTEGFDDPGVVACILTRKPEHAGTYLQMVGRVLRPAEGKTHAQLIDLGGTVWDHGLPDDDREYDLDGHGIKTGEAPPRQCPECGACFGADEVVDGRCPECGAQLPTQKRELPVASGDGVKAFERPPPRPPIQITAKFPGRCHRCHRDVRVGELAAWSPGPPKFFAHWTCHAKELTESANRLLKGIV